MRQIQIPPLERWQWLILSLLLFFLITIFGCLCLIVTGKVAPLG